MLKQGIQQKKLIDILPALKAGFQITCEIIITYTTELGLIASL